MLRYGLTTTNWLTEFWNKDTNEQRVALLLLLLSASVLARMADITHSFPEQQIA